MKVRRLKLADRVAIAELLHLTGVLGEAIVNSERTGNTAAAACNKALGLIVTERAASIVRGEAGGLVMSQGDIQEFADEWGADKPAFPEGPK